MSLKVSVCASVRPRAWVSCDVFSLRVSLSGLLSLGLIACSEIYE